MLATLFASALILSGQDAPSGLPDRPVSSLPTEILRLTNAARNRVGAPPLHLNEALTKAAQAHADDMARRGYFSHESPDGSDMVDRVRRAAYRYRGLAENIAMGQVGAKQVVEGWLRSSGHRRNMLNPEYRDLGVGYAKDEKGVTRWVQVFGTRR